MAPHVEGLDLPATPFDWHALLVRIEESGNCVMGDYEVADLRELVRRAEERDRAVELLRAVLRDVSEMDGEGRLRDTTHEALGAFLASLAEEGAAGGEGGGGNG